MKNIKRKLMTMGLVALVALTAALPASASTVHSISVGGYFNRYVHVGDIGYKAKIHVVNDGSYGDSPVYYELSYGYPGLQYGMLMPGEEFTWEGYHTYYGTYPYPDSFEFYLYCAWRDGPCSGTGTLEILE